MPSIRPSSSRQRAERRSLRARNSSTALAAAALTTVLALTVAACGPSDNEGSSDPSASADQQGSNDLALPKDINDKLKDLGLDLDKWKDGAWKDFDKEWLREAGEFINPIIKDLWDPDRMKDAEEPDQPVQDDIADDQGVTDPEPQPVDAQQVQTPYSTNAPEAGKVFFDGPEGSMVCSATVVKDPANPGKSNMVWTAGHCVHAGKGGGWYRNVMFVPSYNDSGLSIAELENAPKEKIAPKGLWWAEWAQTSDQWIEQGAKVGGQGAPYDFAVLKVKPEDGSGKSLEETVGGALPVEFDAPAVKSIEDMTATGYPAAAPFNGQSLHQCTDKPGRLSLNASQPTMYRIGCRMTAGSSGGGWVAKGKDGQPALVSNTSIGPANATWLAGPHLGDEAKGVYTAVSKKFANR
ncbi:trypsin-like serine peptidase [Streptomyces sp. 796.1]|uniref:trypsin-like serine peptidase n=1 Tax=Streptomyces sp. 796.1 TaxID=3163029 RepID=UPI0039C9451A